jgi:hypothetical protein
MGEQLMTITLNGSDLTVTQVMAAGELIPFTQADGTLPADLEPLVGLVTGGTLTPAA